MEVPRQITYTILFAKDQGYFSAHLGGILENGWGRGFGFLSEQWQMSGHPTGLLFGLRGTPHLTAAGAAADAFEACIEDLSSATAWTLLSGAFSAALDEALVITAL